MSGEQEIYLCFICGAKNRIAANGVGTPICGSCGKPLRAAKEVKARQRPDRSQPGPWLLTSIFARYWGVALIALVVGVPWIWGALTKVPVRLPPLQEVGTLQTPPIKTNTQAPIPSLRPNLKPVAIRPGMAFNRTGRAPLAPFQIRTSPGANYYLKLVDARTKLDAIAVYVVGGRVLEVDVPLGNYEMKYAAGKQWYGPKALFGPDTAYSKSDSLFDFRETVDGYSGYTVELILQTGGNMHTYSIDPSAF